MIFILPRFSKVYEMRSASLPGPTRVLMGIGDFVTTQWMYYLPVLAVTPFSYCSGSEASTGPSAATG